jgi:hypothetical protein
MIQPHGMVLEGGVAIGHGGVSRVAGFGEQAEVGKTEVVHQGGAGLSSGGAKVLQVICMNEHANEQCG